MNSATDQKGQFACAVSQRTPRVCQGDDVEQIAARGMGQRRDLSGIEDLARLRGSQRGACSGTGSRPISVGPEDYDSHLHVRITPNEENVELTDEF
jgi:hypothetical protein